MNQDNRISYWDNLRFFLILCVVLGHFLSQFVSESAGYRMLFIFIYSFHMPLFIFVSGEFHKDTHVSVRVVQFLSYYIILKGIIGISRALIYGNAISFSLLSEDGLAWYMFALAVYIGVTYLLRKINVIYLLIISVILALLAGYDSSIGDYLVLSRVIVYYPFYLLGVAVPREKIEQAAAKTNRKIAGLIGALLFLGICIFFNDQLYSLRGLFTGRNSYSNFAFIQNDGCFYRLLCYGITIFAAACIMLVIPCRRLPQITLWGQRTIQVYTWHYVFIYLFNQFHVTRSLCSSGWGGRILWLVIGIAVTILLSFSWCRYPSYWVFRQGIIYRSRDGKDER